MIAPDCEVSSCLGIIQASDVYLCESETFVGILNDGRHAITVQREEGRLFQLGGHVDLGRIGYIELLEEEGYFPRVWSGCDRSAKP